MSDEEVVRIFAWVLVLAPIFNVFFVLHGFLLWRRIGGSLLFGLFVIKATVWLVGLAIGIYSIRFLMGKPPFPFDGLSLAVVLLIVNLIPVYIHIVLRRYEHEP